METQEKNTELNDLSEIRKILHGKILAGQSIVSVEDEDDLYELNYAKDKEQMEAYEYSRMFYVS
jgi:hypothetical protein